jgi:AcrR family transcriptional regulator
MKHSLQGGIVASRTDQREHVIERLKAHLLATGLSQASLRQLAAAAGISDRMLLYYFADKTEVLAEAMSAIAADFSASLDTVLPEGETAATPVLLDMLTQMALSDQTRPLMRLWLEATAAAARGEAPFVAITRKIAEGFLLWIEGRLDLVSGTQRAERAAMILAMVDGLVLLEVCTSTATAQAAAKAMRAAFSDT